MRFSPPSRWGVVESERSDLLENDLLFFGEKTSQRLNVPFTHLNVMSYDPNSLKSRVLFVTSNFLLKELIGLYIYIYISPINGTFWNAQKMQKNKCNSWRYSK